MKSKTGEDGEVLIIGGSPVPISRSFEPHIGGARESVEARLDDIVLSYERALRQLDTLVAKTPEGTENGWKVNELKIALGLDAKGRVGFLGAGAEAGVQATFEVTISRA